MCLNGKAWVQHSENPFISSEAEVHWFKWKGYVAKTKSTAKSYATMQLATHSCFNCPP